MTVRRRHAPNYATADNHAGTHSYPPVSRSTHSSYVSCLGSMSILLKHRIRVDDGRFVGGCIKERISVGATLAKESGEGGLFRILDTGVPIRAISFLIKNLAPRSSCFLVVQSFDL